MNVFTESIAWGIGGTELYVILGIALLLFGGKKIPELMRGVGQGVGQLQKGLEEGKRTLHAAAQEEASAVDKADALENPKAVKPETTAPLTTEPRA